MAPITLQRILIIDDHQLFREGLGLLLSKLRPKPKLSFAGTSQEGLTLMELAPPSLVLLDIRLPDNDGQTFLKSLSRKFPQTPVAIVSSLDSPGVIRECKKRGAVAFIPKSSSADRFVEVIKKILTGGEWFPFPLGNGEKGTDGAAALTSRQLHVLETLAGGDTNKDIGRRLGITENTVRAHLAQIFKILQVSTRTEAVRRFHEINPS
jgi:DNA-binding NarL/FixJ family response regulator